MAPAVTLVMVRPMGRRQWMGPVGVYSGSRNLGQTVELAGGAWGSCPCPQGVVGGGWT